MSTVLLAISLSGCGEESGRQPLVHADPEAGRAVIARIGCQACHVVPGIAGPRGRVGPSLDGFARRRYIAGTLPNLPTVLVAWIQNAPELVPQTAMPALPVSEKDASDVAAYLYTLR